MALDGRSQLYKCILFIINIVLAVAGLTILVLGIWVRFSTQEIFNALNLNTTSFVSVVTLLIILGALMMVISAIGNYGACKENNCILTVLVVLLSLQLIFAIAAGTLAISQNKEIGELLSGAYTTTYLQYEKGSGDPSKDPMLQLFHNTFDCCGLLGGFLGAIKNDPCANGGLLEFVYSPSKSKQPCPTAIASKDYRGPLIGGLTGILVLMILALICSIFLRKGISSSSDPSYNITVSTTVQQGISLGKTNR